MSTITPVTDPRFDPNYGESNGPPKKRSMWANCLIGCLIVLVVMLVLGVILIVWISRNWRGWTADFGSGIAKQAIAQSELPEQEKIDINSQIDRLATAFRQDRISGEKMGQLMENFAQSPLMTSFMVSAIEEKYFATSGLSAEEKAAGRSTLQRFMRGMIDKSISEQGIDDAMQHVATKDPGGEWQVKQQLTDEELRAFLKAANQEADLANVPAQPADFDPSDEFKKIVDEAIGEPAAEAEPQAIPQPEAEPVK